MGNLQTLPTLTKKNFLVYYRTNAWKGFAINIGIHLVTYLILSYMLIDYVMYKVMMFTGIMMLQNIVNGVMAERENGLSDFLTAQGSRSLPIHGSLVIYASALIALNGFLAYLLSHIPYPNKNPSEDYEFYNVLSLYYTALSMLPFVLYLNLLVRLTGYKGVGATQIGLSFVTVSCHILESCENSSFKPSEWTMMGWIIPQYVYVFSDKLEYVELRYAVIFVYSFLVYAYFDHVVPRADEVRHPWYYIFMESYWFGTSKSVESSLPNQPLAASEEFKIEAFTPSQLRHIESGEGVHILNVEKHFTSASGTVKALDGLNLAMFPSEIVALLGHNGAGKSTLQGILTGRLTMTSGSARLFGFDLETELSDILAVTGICMQEDVLWSRLTVMDHLSISAGLRRVPRSLRRRQAMDLLELLGIQAKLDTQACDLSGGMRRRLSMALAFVSDPKLILLDEPTSGVDPVTRRSLWTFLKSKRSERVICISTHYMDEAEVLGDRIAIMAAGQLKAYGTSIFLKEAYGIGYDIIFSKNSTQTDKATDSRILAKVRASIERAYISASEREILVIQVPLSAAEEFESLLIDFDANMDKYAIENYSVSTSKLEDVYNRVSDPTGQQSRSEEIDSLKLDSLRLNRGLWNNILAHYSFRLFEDILNVLWRSIFTLILVAILYWVAIPWFREKLIHILYEECKSGEMLANITSLVMFDILIWRNIVAFILAIVIGVMSNSVGKRFKVEVDNGMKEHLINSGTRRFVYWSSILLHGILKVFTIVVPLVALIVFTFPSPASGGDSAWMKALGEISVFEKMFDIPETRKFEKLAGLKFVKTGIFSALFIFSKSALLHFPSVDPKSIAFALIPEGKSTLFDNATGIDISNLDAAVSKALVLLGYEFKTVETFFMILLLTFFCIVAALYRLILPKSAGYLMDVILPFVALLGVQYIFMVVLYDMSNFNFWPLQSQTNLAITLSALSVGLCFLLLLIDSGLSLFACGSEPKPIDLDESASILRISNVTKTFSGMTAVDNLSLEISNGEVYGLLGVNGAGKTTAIKIALGMISPDQGEVTISGYSIRSNRLECMQRVGYCSQDDILFDNLTVRQNVSIFGRNRGVTPVQIDDHVSIILDYLDLRRFETRKAVTLSGGNKRRLCVAMAIAGGPVLSVYDEPSAGLDPLARHRLWNVVKMLSRSNTRSVLITTHLMEEADALSHQLGIMVNGSIRATGSPQELKSSVGGVFEVTMVVPQKSDTDIMALASSLSETIDEESSLINSASISFVEAEAIVQRKYSAQMLANFRKDFGMAYKPESIHSIQLAEWVIDATSAEKVSRWVAQFFIGKRRLVQESDGILKWEVSDFGSVVELFKILEKAKNGKIISQYTIAQPSLDQVFTKVCGGAISTQP